MSTALRSPEVSVIGKASSISEVLSKLQKELKVPKEKKNSFGNYKYRTAEDILSRIKDIMPDGAYVLTDDKIELIGERHYIICSAYFCYNGQTVISTGYAREPLAKKGFDESQITGAASSYAKKYALNGLFAIDDTEDADCQDNRDSGVKKLENVNQNGSGAFAKLQHLISVHKLEDKVGPWLNSFNVTKLADIPEEGLIKILHKVKDSVSVKEVK